MSGPFGHLDGCVCWRCHEYRDGDVDGLGPYRARTADPLVCEHPEDDRMPISGDGWLCEHCGAFVDRPPQRVFDAASEHVARLIESGRLDGVL